MRRGPRANPIIKMACGAPPYQRRTRDRCPSERQGTFASGFCPERTPAAASAR
jgi:hypothetical protein